MTFGTTLVLCTQRQLSDEVIVLQLRAWVRDNSPVPGSGVRYMNWDLVFVSKVTNFPVPRMAGNSLTRRTILSASQVRRYSLGVIADPSDIQHESSSTNFTCLSPEK